MNQSVLSTALKGIAVAMGIAVIVLNALGALEVSTAIALLGIGVTTLAIESLRQGGVRK